MADLGRINHVHRQGDHLYFRRGNFRCKLHSPEGSEELRREADGILAHLLQLDRMNAPTAGTVGEALDFYMSSADFLSRSPTTKSDYARRAAELKEDVGDVLLSGLDFNLVTSLKTAWAQRGHRVAALHLQVLKNACTAAVFDGRIPSDPFSRQKEVKRPYDAGEPNPAWRDAEVEASIEEALSRGLPGLARAIGLGRYGGFRRSTICAIPLTCRVTVKEGAVDRRRLYWLTKKAQVLLDKPEDGRLTRLLEQTPNRAETIAYNADDQPFKVRGLNQAVDRLLAKLAVEGKVRPHLTLHGLRHARGVELANVGASDAEIMSQLEHRSTRAAQIYRRQAQRRDLADSAQNKIDQTLAKQARAAGRHQKR